MKTGLDNEFQELNRIHLNHQQKNALWRNIQRKSKRSSTVISLKNIAVSILAIAVMLILTFNLIDLSANKHHNTATPNAIISQQVDPPKTAGNPEIRDNSKGWQLDGRMRYDIATIENLDTNLKELSQLEVKRQQSFGTDNDPDDPQLTLNEPIRTFPLQTILNQQVLKFHNGQKILLTTGQYAKANVSSEPYRAKVLGYAKEDGKFYDLKGKLMNLTISSRVSIKDGELQIKQ